MTQTASFDPRMNKHHGVENIHFVADQLVLTIDGVQWSFTLQQISQVLASATDVQRHSFEISPSGYGISWPLLDEDLSLDGLIGVDHGPKPDTRKVQ